MYQGSHARAKKHSRIRMNKLAILFIAVVMLIGAAVGTTVAFLVTDTQPVTNTFEYAKVSCEVIEDTWDRTTKSGVHIKNTGDIPVYVRATYIITWRDADGNIVPTPDGYSYDLTGVTETTKWVQGKNGYYYYTEPVAPNGQTDGSLLTCTTKQPAGGEYSLHVEVVAESIQSDPANAITEAWGVTPPNWN